MAVYRDVTLVDELKTNSIVYTIVYTILFVNYGVIYAVGFSSSTVHSPYSIVYL